MASLVVKICISLMTNEYFLRFFLAIQISSFVKFLFKYCAHVSIGLFVIFLLIVSV